MSSSGRRSRDVYDYFPSSDASIEEDSDIEDGDEAHRPEDPESMGYLPLTCLNSDDDDEVEFAEQVDLRKTSTYNLSLGEDHDEVHDVDSSGSSSDEPAEEPAEGETGGGAGEPLGDVEMEIDHNYDNEDDGQGRISSGSHYLYARIDNDYDEEHIVESSSSEPSPRDPQPLLESQSTSNLPVYPTNNRNIYSRHYPSLSSHGTQSNSRSTSTGVDTGIRFNALGSGLASRDRNATFDRSTFGSSAYNYRDSHRSSSTVSGYPVYNSQYGGSPSSHPSQTAANTVRGMNMPSTSTTDRTSDEVKINMPGPLGERSSLLPGGVLHKRTSSRYTADIDVPLSNLDRRFPGASSDSCSRPGYDSRQYYNNPSSLEAQMPGRSSASTTTTQSHSTRAHNSYGSIQTEIPPTDPAEAVTENSSLSKKKEKQKKRAEREKKSVINIQEVEGYVGNKQIEELLEFLGEETTDASKSESSKKKKDKKEKKKTETDAPSTDKKRDKSNVDVSVDNRKRDNNSMGSKRKESNSKKKENKKRTVKSGGDVTDNQVVTSSDTNSAAAAIIHTTNNRLVSRIILNGGNITSCSSESSEATEHKSLEPDSDDLHSGAGVQFSERNIDEAIAKSQQQSGPSTVESQIPTQVESEETTTYDSSAAGSECKTAEAITTEAAAVSSINQQTIDVTYSIHLPDHYWVEEDFVRVKTPEPAEEEFKQVIHKKKKGHQNKHHSQAAAVSSSTDSIRIDMDQCKLHSEQSEELNSHACDLTLPQQVTMNKNTLKPKLLPDRKAPSSHNQISKLSSPTMRALAACDNIKPYSKAATSCKLTPANVSRNAPAPDQRPAQDQQRPAQDHRPPHYDMSESSFPTLATNDNIKSCNPTQSKVATVKPISWAHLASKPQHTMQQTKTKPPDQADGNKDSINKLGPNPEGSSSYADYPDKGALLDNKDTVQSDKSFKDTCASNVIQAMNCPKPSDGRIMSSTRDAVVLPTAKTGERNETKCLKQSGYQNSTQKSRALPAQKVQFGFGIGDPNSEGMNLMFGLDDEILQQTSLKSRTKVNSNIDNNSTYTISSCDASSAPPVPSDKTEQVLQPNTDLLSVDVNINNKSELETDGQTYAEYEDSTPCDEAQEDSKINMGVNILPNLLSMEETNGGDKSNRKVSHPPYLLKIIRSLNKDWDDIKKQLSSRNSSSRTRRVMYWTEKLD